MVLVEAHAPQLLITQKELGKEGLFHYGKLLVTRNYHKKISEDRLHPFPQNTPSSQKRGHPC